MDTLAPISTDAEIAMIRGDLEVELHSGGRTALCLTNVQTRACPMDLEVTSQLIASDSADMAAEIEPDLSRSGDVVSITEEVHSFHICVDEQTILQKIVSNIGTCDRQWHEERC